MSSTESWPGSSRTDRYQGPEYRRALAGPPDPWLHPDPGHPPRLYRALLAVISHLVRWLFTFHVEGLEHLPSPPFIVASNHQGWYDTIFILAALARASPRLPMVYTMARQDTVFNRGWKRWLMPRLGVFPIMPRLGELDEQGVGRVYRVLGSGGVVLLFPEGRYSRGRQLRPLRKGVAHFALQAGVAICPVAIAGLERLRPGGAVRISVGLPVWPTPPRWWDLNRRVLRLVDSVRRAILRAFDRGDARPSKGRLGGLAARLSRLRLRLRPPRLRLRPPRLRLRRRGVR